MKERIAIIDGLRTPMAKIGTALKTVEADELGTEVVRALIRRNDIPLEDYDELIMGNVAQPAHAANIARVISLKAGLPISLPSYTVHRNCASGMESLTTASSKILSGQGSVYLVGGTESMSNIPLLFNEEFKAYMEQLSRTKTGLQRLKQLLKFRFRMLKPVIGVVQGLTDPVSGLIMGMTAENLAQEFQISREEQDSFALLSHQRAVKAQEEGAFADELLPIPITPNYSKILTEDVGPRKDQSMEQLAKLRPYFDRRNGTVTVGNACPLTDGAAALIVMSESEAKKRGLKPLGFMKDFSYASLEPERMGLGPTYATHKLFEKTGVKLKDIDYIEINEAFAAQIIANERAFNSKAFSRKYLNSDTALGEIERDKFNLQGGAIALGHPVGMTGTRLVLHTLLELRRQKKELGLASLCIGGGQGASLLLEAA